MFHYYVQSINDIIQTNCKLVRMTGIDAIYKATYGPVCFVALLNKNGEKSQMVAYLERDAIISTGIINKHNSYKVTVCVP